MDALERRYRARSLWLDTVEGPLVPRPGPSGDVDCDVAIVGAGFIGLWAAYALAEADPALRIRVLEAEIAGFGAAGRNAGFVSAGIAGEARVYRRHGGMAAVQRAERVVIEAIDDIGRVVAEEAIDCGYTKGGSLRIATSAAQLARIREGLAARRARGFGESDAWLVSAAEIRERVRIAGVIGGAYTPHCGRVDPARLTRGLAETCERRGVVIHEQTRALDIRPGAVRCETCSVRAPIVVRATESYTTRLPGERRSFMPVYSQAIATEPLPASFWNEVGWEHCETVADQRYLFRYAQRTRDDRIMAGGAGAPYHFRSAIRERDEAASPLHDRVEATLRAWFPALAGARITHRWAGPFAVPRDWSMSIEFDRATGLILAGGLSGHGITAGNVAGRTIADLVMGRPTELTGLPWVGHRSRRWEPEPVRLIASHAITRLLSSADAVEDRGLTRARRASLVTRWTPGR